MQTHRKRASFRALAVAECGGSTLSPADALKTAEAFGAKPLELQKEVHKTHIFTHIVWDMVGYHIFCSVKADGFIWATPQELETTYALPTAFRIFLEE